MRRLTILIAALLFARVAAGQTADDYRGGWRTDGGEAHTYEFSIRGSTVRGIYCTYCADAPTLAFVDGTFGPDGLRFEVTHVHADGSTAYADTAVATFSQGRLTVTGTSGTSGGGRFERVLIKDPGGPIRCRSSSPSSRRARGSRWGAGSHRGHSRQRLA